MTVVLMLVSFAGGGRGVLSRMGGRADRQTGQRAVLQPQVQFAAACIVRVQEIFIILKGKHRLHSVNINANVGKVHDAWS